MHYRIQHRMKYFLRSLWFFYSVTAFFIMVTIFFPFYLITFIIFGERAVRPLIWLSHRVVGPLSLSLMLIFLKTHGREKIDNKQTYVVVCNHQSAIDVLLFAAGPLFLFKFLAKKEIEKIPLFGYIVNKFSILINRSSPESRQEGVERMKKALREGFSVFIAPEGTRHYDNDGNDMLAKFYDGAFRLAIETGTPLLVQTLAHSGKLNNPNRKYDMSPGLVHCYFDTPIDTTNMTVDDIPTLKKQARKMMLEHLT